MLSTMIKRTIATTLSGAAIAGTIGAPAASAMPIDPVGAPGEPGDVLIVPSPRSSAPRGRRGVVRLPIDTSRLKFLVVVDMEPLRQYEERKPRDRVSLSSNRAGRSAAGAVRWREGRSRLGEAA